MRARIGVFLALFGVFWLFELPVYVDAIALVCLGAASALVTRAKLVLLLASLVFAAGVAELVARTLLVPSTREPFYRPHEKFEREKGYQPDVDETFSMPHGDIVAIHPFLETALAEPRVVRFKTDALGYRNDRDYRSEPIVLVGDSLVVGTGNDQEDILTNVLRRDFELSTYSIAFPMGPKDYFAAVEEFARQVDTSFRVILLVFEGNDFHGPGRSLAKPNAYDTFKRGALNAMGFVFKTGRFVFNTTRRWERTLFPGKDTETEVYWVGERRVSFYGSYIDKATAESLRFDAGHPSAEVMDRVSAVFFIPTKYRVYFQLLGNTMGRRIRSPPPGYVAVRSFFEEHEIPVVDLTPPLFDSARELLEKDQYVFWRDDTHWNANGVRVAAEHIARYFDEKSLPSGRQ